MGVSIQIENNMKHQQEATNDCKGEGNDKRFTLTPWEHRSVAALKDACEKENVAYKSLFELAKYVLVSKSTVADDDEDADAKRLEVALDRMKKMRAWEAEYGLNDIDPLKAIDEFDANAPEFYVNHYLKDRGEGLVVVAHALTKSKYVFKNKENLATFFASETYRMDLAAADLEEARRGVAILIPYGEGGFKVGPCVQYVRQLIRTSSVIAPMHSHRIRRVYVQCPPQVTRFVNTCKSILPKKIASRVVVATKLSELDQLVETSPDNTRSVRQWVSERSKVYAETIQRLEL